MTKGSMDFLYLLFWLVIAETPYEKLSNWSNADDGPVA